MSRPPWLPVALLQVRLLLRSPLWWGMVLLATVAVLFINPAAMIPTGGQAVGGVRPVANSPLALAQSMALGGLLFHGFLATLLTGLAVIRDRETRVDTLLLTTTLGPVGHTAGTLAGGLAALVLIGVIHCGLALAWIQFGHLLGGDAVLGPFRASAYLGALLGFLLPGLLAAGCLGALAASLGRSTLAVFGSACAMLALGLAGLTPRSLAGLLASLTPLLDLLDFWGCRWLAERVFTGSHGVEYYNTALVPIDGEFLRMRLAGLGLLPLALAGGLLAARLDYRGAGTPGSFPRRLWGRPRSAPYSGTAPGGSVSAPDTGGEGGPPGPVVVARETLRLELGLLFTRPWTWLLVPLGFLLALDHGQALRGVFDSRPLHTATGLATGLSGLLTVIGCLLLAWHQAESAGRARRLGLEPLRDCRPVHPAGVLLGRQLAGLLLVLLPLAGAALGCAFLLESQPGGPIGSHGMPVLVWGGLLLPGLLFWSALVNALASRFDSRAVIWLVAFMILAASAALFFMGRLDWLLNWPLWGVFHAGELAVFQPDRGPLLLNRVLVVSVALLLNLYTVAPRGSRSFRIAVPITGLLALTCAALLWSGMARGWQGSVARQRDDRYWALNHDGPAGLSVSRHPRLVHLEAGVRIEPDQGLLVVQGHCLLEPRTADPVTGLAFTLLPLDSLPRFRVDGLPVEVEDRSGLFVLHLTRALAGTAPIRVEFAYHTRVPRGWSRLGGGRDSFILPGGLALGMLEQPFLPLPGYRPDRGRPADQPVHASGDETRAVPPPVLGQHGRFTARLAVDAPSGYTINGVGTLVAEQVNGGRTHRVWRCTTPVSFLNLVGGPLRERRGAGVAVYYHAGHEANLEELVRTLEGARLWYSRWFMALPWPGVNLTELPALASSAQGYPGNIPFPEDLGFLTRSDDRSRLPSVVAAHEVAHQWWGNLLTPAAAPGADLLIEGAAHYSAARLLEELYGPAARDSFLLELERNWNRERRPDVERALLEMENTGEPAQETVFYDKGAWVLWMLENHLGRSAMEHGLGQFFEHFSGERHPPRVTDLLETLAPLAADSGAWKDWVQTWFHSPAAPELRITETRTSRQGADWVVRARIRNLGSGRVAPVLELRDEQGLAVGERLRVRALEPGPGRWVEWRVGRRPVRVVVDPGMELLQLNRALSGAALH